MAIVASDRNGMLIVRIWIEGTAPSELRARITQTLDTLATEKAVAVAATSDGILAIVKQWVEDFTTPN
jgi:hypothetical protein